jgi:hypothetical protein
MTFYQTTSYQQRVNAERLARQAPAVQKTAKAILKETMAIDQCLYWALDPDKKNQGFYWLAGLIEHAHMLVDLGHEYRAELAAALAANPPEEPEKDSGQ